MSDINDLKEINDEKWGTANRLPTDSEILAASYTGAETNINELRETILAKWGTEHRQPTSAELLAAWWDPDTGGFPGGGGGGGGPAVYTAVVPDDYATLSSALASLAEGSSVFIKPGTYTEAGGSFSTAKISIHGAGNGSTTLVLSNTLTLSGESVSLKDITVDTNSGKRLVLSGSYSIIENSRIINGTVANFLETGLFNGTVNNVIRSASANGTVKFGERGRMTGNHFTVPHIADGGIYLGAYASFVGNLIYRFESAQYIVGGPLLFAWGEKSTISTNVFFCGLNAGIELDYRCTVNGNSFFQAGGGGSNSKRTIVAKDGCSIVGNIIHLATQGVAIGVDGRSTGYSVIVSGNNISDSGSFPGTEGPQSGHTGIHVVSGVKSIITGNSIAGTQIGLQIDSGVTGTTVSSNAFSFVTTAIANDGTGTIISDNQGATNDPSGGGGVTVYRLPEGSAGTATVPKNATEVISSSGGTNIILPADHDVGFVHASNINSNALSSRIYGYPGDFNGVEFSTDVNLNRITASPDFIANITGDDPSSYPEASYLVWVAVSAGNISGLLFTSDPS